jgi:hypothetical protein
MEIPTNYFFFVDRYDDIRSPLPQSISQLSLYNSNSHQNSGLIEPLPYHRPIPIPPTPRSIITDFHSSGKFKIY